MAFQPILKTENNPLSNDDFKKLTEIYLGCPYILEPFDDGQNRIPTHAFDCVSFVETMMAFRLAEKAEERLKILDRIRYRHDKPDFFYRNYVMMSADWVPVNIDKNFIRPLTRQIATAHNLTLKTASCIADRPSTFTKKNKQGWDAYKKHNNYTDLTLPEDLSAVKTSIDYLDLKDLLKAPDILSTIPDCSIIMIVRPDWDVTELIGTHLNISHLGFLIRTPQATYLRHASSIHQKVVDEPLKDYLEKYADETKTSVRGIAVFEAV